MFPWKIYYLKTILWGLFCALGARAVAQITQSPALQPLHAAAYNQQFADIFSSRINPALLGSIRDFEAGAWAEKKYFLPGLQQYQLIAGVPAAGSGWAFSMDYSGISHYRNWETSLSYGKKLGKWSIGAAFNYAAQSASGYGNQSQVSGSIGALWELSNVITTGMQLYRLGGDLFSNSPALRPAYGYAAGLGWLVAGGILLEATLTGHESQRAAIQAGLHYKAGERLMASCFLNLSDSRPSIRVKWLTGLLQLGVTGSYHAVLGFSPGVLLIVSGAKKGGL